MFRYRGFRFFFYSNEGSPREPLRVHVRSGSSEAQLNQFELSPRGIHWDALDEDISIDGLLTGHGDRAHGRLVVPA